MQAYPFRLGTTSYIIPADILPNAHYLAGKVRDIELILFEVDDGPNNLPSTEVIDELLLIAQQHDLTYTVHFRCAPWSWFPNGQTAQRNWR